MKKYLKFILSMLTVLIFLSSCNNDGSDKNVHSGEPHTHSFSAWEEIKPSSCTEKGERKRICNLCDYSEYSETEILPHDLKTSPAVAPTCTSSGKSEGSYCGRCNTVFTEQTVIAPIGHQYNNIEILEEAFFWRSGKLRFMCSRGGCDSSYEQPYSISTVTQTENYTETSDKLYSFSAISDIHITRETANEDFARALAYAESNCDFTCIAGDLTVSGSKRELDAYRWLVEKYAKTKPVYAITGNHENYSTTCKDFLEDYTGQPLYYSFTKGDDVFIMIGHYGGYAGDGAALGAWRPSEFLSIEEVRWLYETLEANRNKRCFIFTHVLPHEDGVGNPLGLYTTAPIWFTETSGGLHDNGLGKAVLDMIKHYKNAILFHGHSHTRLSLQELDPKANCSAEDGYRSVHIPSLALPRDVENGKLVYAYEESEGYIIDVYEDYIILNGWDFIDNDGDGNRIPGATYRIDTRLCTIEANTFVDTSGFIIPAQN